MSTSWGKILFSDFDILHRNFYDIFMLGENKSSKIRDPFFKSRANPIKEMSSLKMPNYIRLYALHYLHLDYNITIVYS